MRVVRALQHRRQLRVPHPRLLPGGADGSRADAHLDDVGPGEDQGLGHLAGHHVAGLQCGQSRVSYKL